MIIASPGDIHAAAVTAHILSNTDGEVAILDSADFPTHWRLSASFASECPGMQCRVGCEGWFVDDQDLKGVWWRRPRRHRITPQVTDRRARRFCRDESAAMFQGWLLSLGSRVLNPLGFEYMAERKVYQLHHARRLGLPIPETLVTSDPDAARAFLGGLKARAIFKVLTGTSWRFTETRVFEKDHEPLLETLVMSPVIFQELVDADRHIRATIVDGQVFSCSVRPVHPEAKIDWRLDQGVEIEPHPLPSELADRLVRLLDEMGLRYGALDLILKPDGNYVFLEINPAGQYLFAEIHAGLPITAAVAHALLEGPPARPTGSMGHSPSR